MEPITRPALDKLSEAHYRGIGEVMFEWSLYEHALQRLVWAMLDLSPARARIAVRSPRATDLIVMIQDLAHAESFTIDLGSLKATGEVERRRNMVAHGIWYDDGDGRVLLQDSTGSWDPEGDRPRIKRRILLAAAPITPANLADLSGAIRTLTHNVYTVARAIQERRATPRQDRPQH